MRTGALYFYIFILLVLQACTQSRDQGFITQKAAVLTGMSIDSFASKFQLVDSNEVSSLGLSFYEFAMKDNYPDNQSKSYLLIFDSSGNYFMLSRAKPGMYDYSAQSLQVMTEGAITKKVDWLRVKQYPLELKIETILNSLTVDVKKRLNSENLDSVFKYTFANHLAYPANSKNKRFIRISNLTDVDSVFNNLKKQCDSTYQPDFVESLYFNEYKSFVDTILNKEGFYAYTTKNYDQIMVVSINEDFISEEKCEYLYKMYTDNEKLYRIHIYVSP